MLTGKTSERWQRIAGKVAVTAFVFAWVTGVIAIILWMAAP